MSIYGTITLSQPEREALRISQSSTSPERILSADAPSASPDRAAEADRLAVLPRIPRDNDGPVFAEPWQAQAFAMAVKLSQQGYFTWKEWAAALASELQAAADCGERDDGSRYYEHWLAALERLVVEKGLSDRAALAERKEAWIEAYRRTPHGKPVELNPREK